MPVMVGFAQSVITPPLPVQLAGHRGPRMASAVADDLHARAAVFSDGDTLYAIVACDLIWLPRRVVMYAKDLISRSAAVRPQNVMVTCTHTHSGPDTLDWYAFAAPIPQWWLDWLAHALASTVYRALHAMNECSMRRGEAEFAQAVNRRKMVGDVVYRQPNDMGQVDRRMSVLSFAGASGVIGGIVHAGMHPVVLGADSTVVSGDWCGIMMNEMARRHGGIWLFLNGVAGDNNPKLWSGGNSYDTLVACGHRAADDATAALAKAQAFAAPVVTARVATGRYESQSHAYLTVEQDRRTREDAGLQIDTQALRLGSLTLVGLAGECVFDVGHKITSAVGDCWVVSYANDYVGYLVTKAQYREGGYEPAASMLSADGSENYVDAAIANGRAVNGRV